MFATVTRGKGHLFVAATASVAALLTTTPPPALGQSSEAVAGPRWQLPETSHEFGVVWAGFVVEHPFKFKNIGSETLKILEARPRCSCSVSENYTREVVPGEYGVIPFKLKTANKMGRIAETLAIKTNDPVNRYMTLELTGIVKKVATYEVIEDANVPRGSPEFESVRKMGASFGRIKADDHLRRVLKLTNTSGQPLDLTPLAITPQGAPFSAELKTTRKGKEFELTIVGTPPFPKGHTSATVSFKTNIPEQEIWQVGIFAYVPDRIEIIPEKIVVDPQYPPVPIRKISVRDNGDRHFEITSVAASNPDIDLRVLPAHPTTPQTRDIRVKLPLGRYAPPPYGDVIRITTDDPEKPLVDVYVLPKMGVDPAPRPEDKPLEFFPGRLN